MINQNSYSGKINTGVNTRGAMYVLLILGGIIIALVAAQFGFVYGMAVAALPIVSFIVFGIIANPYWGLITIFAMNFFVMGIKRYIPSLPAGPIMDVLIVLTLVGVFVQSSQRRLEWSNAANGLTVATIIWTLFCVMEIFNLEGASAEAWATSIRGVAFYFLLISILTPVLFGKYRDLKRILYIWSAFTLVAVLKAYIQKNYGFDPFELRWLYEDGGQTTHIIYTGIRYFSIFTDAANFGAGMGCSMVVFSLCALAIKETGPKLYFLAVGFLAAYAMMISGTRGAIAVPFVGYALYIILSKNWKVIIVFTVAIVGAFCFLKYTTHLEGNTYVRRMRSAFDPNDPSLRVRFDNQSKMKVYLKNRPFGVGLGMGGGKAKEHAPTAYMSQLPTDSWFVMLWAETGIIGLLLYLTILVYLLIKCSIIVMFRVKDKKLRGILAALLCGTYGVIVCSYGNEVVGQFPNGIILYVMIAFIFMGERFDKQIAEEREQQKAIGNVSENS